MLDVQSFMDSLPPATFAPGAGLTALTATNANAVSAETTKPQQPGSIGAIVLPSENIFVWLGIGIVALLLYKAWTERNGEGHVADFRIGLTNILFGAAAVWIGRYLWLLGAGVGVAHNVPGAKQVAKFFAT